MLGRDGKKCTACEQYKSNKSFLPHSLICIICQRMIQQEGDGDEGGSGGKQLQYNQSAESLHKAIELDAASQKDRDANYLKSLDKALFQLVEKTRQEKNTQQQLREQLDKNIEDEKSVSEDTIHDTNSSKNTKFKRNEQTHLFSVTRNAALNVRAQNLARANNFQVFSQKNAQKTPTSVEAATANKNTSSFYQKQTMTEESIKQEAKKIVEALREVKNIFKQ